MRRITPYCLLLSLLVLLRWFPKRSNAPTPSRTESPNYVAYVVRLSDYDDAATGTGWSELERRAERQTMRRRRYLMGRKRSTPGT